MNSILSLPVFLTGVVNPPPPKKATALFLNVIQWRGQLQFSPRTNTLGYVRFTALPYIWPASIPPRPHARRRRTPPKYRISVRV